MTVWGLTNSYNGTPPLPTPKVQRSVDVKHICAPHAHTRDGGGRDQLHGGDHGELEPERLRRQGENVSGRDAMRVGGTFLLPQTCVWPRDSLCQ